MANDEAARHEAVLALKELSRQAKRLMGKFGDSATYLTQVAASMFTNSLF
jgi:hypothetical protein